MASLVAPWNPKNVRGRFAAFIACDRRLHNFFEHCGSRISCYNIEVDGRFVQRQVSNVGSPLREVSPPISQG